MTTGSPGVLRQLALSFLAFLLVLACWLASFLQQRVKAWLLATSSSAQNETRMREFSEAIRSNKVTGDYLHLLERIESDCKPGELIAVCSERIRNRQLKELD